MAHLLVLKTVRRRESKKEKRKKNITERDRETEKKICHNQLLGGDQLHPMAKDVIALSSYSWSHSVLRFSGFAAFTASSKFIRNTERERERRARSEGRTTTRNLPEEGEEESYLSCTRCCCPSKYGCLRRLTR